MIVVVDTSVLLPALLSSQGFIHSLLIQAGERGYVPCVSDAIIDELVAKASELRIEATKIATFRVEQDTLCINGEHHRYTTTEIQQDDHIVGCYRSCRADLVLTSDKALIRKLERLDIPAVRPSEFQAYLT